MKILSKMNKKSIIFSFILVAVILIACIASRYIFLEEYSMEADIRNMIRIESNRNYGGIEMYDRIITNGEIEWKRYLLAKDKQIGKYHLKWWFISRNRAIEETKKDWLVIDDAARSYGIECLQYTTYSEEYDRLKQFYMYEVSPNPLLTLRKMNVSLDLYLSMKLKLCKLDSEVNHILQMYWNHLFWDAKENNPDLKGGLETYYALYEEKRQELWTLYNSAH